MTAPAMRVAVIILAKLFMRITPTEFLFVLKNIRILYDMKKDIAFPWRKAMSFGDPGRIRTGDLEIR
ncbi:MAG: hypothetical protein LKG08_06950, partial [Bifidobacterium tibiigranuli]|nr:hypothetical protein [Bifidobacterium tibiigranuli]